MKMRIDTTTTDAVLRFTSDGAVLVHVGGEVYYVTDPERFISKETIWSGGRRITVFQRVVEGTAFRTKSNDKSPISMVIVLARWIWRGWHGLVETIKGAIEKITPLSALFQFKLGGYNLSFGVKFAAA